VTVAPLTTVVMNAVERDRAGLASGVNNAVSRVGGLLAIAFVGLVVTASFNRSLDRRLDSSGLAGVARQLQPDERAKLGALAPPHIVPCSRSRKMALIGPEVLGTTSSL